MLVVSRKKDESIIIGDNIKVTIVEIAKDRIKIGVDAPESVKIARSELYDTERFNMQAAVNKPSADIIAAIMDKNKK
ncbi:MAG: carbon storage regulator CsrA [Oscillospiraceae bacterium]